MANRIAEESIFTIKGKNEKDRKYTEIEVQ